MLGGLHHLEAPCSDKSCDELASDNVRAVSTAERIDVDFAHVLQALRVSWAAASPQKTASDNAANNRPRIFVPVLELTIVSPEHY